MSKIEMDQGLRLESLIYPTSRLRLFLDDAKFPSLKNDLDWIAITRSGVTADSLSYLFSSKDQGSYQNPLEEISGNKLYRASLEGIDFYGKVTSPDHVFHLIPYQGKWILFDCYLDCRTIHIDLNMFIDQINRLNRFFDYRIWKDITGFLVTNTSAFSVKATITASDYDLRYIDEKFRRLIERAKKKLSRGVDQEHLSLLSPSSNLKGAEAYLASLLGLVSERSWYQYMKSYIY